MESSPQSHCFPVENGAHQAGAQGPGGTVRERPLKNPATLWLCPWVSFLLSPPAAGPLNRKPHGKSRFWGPPWVPGGGWEADWVFWEGWASPGAGAGPLPPDASFLRTGETASCEVQPGSWALGELHGVSVD